MGKEGGGETIEKERKNTGMEGVVVNRRTPLPMPRERNLDEIAQQVRTQRSASSRLAGEAAIAGPIIVPRPSLSPVEARCC